MTTSPPPSSATALTARRDSNRAASPGIARGSALVTGGVLYAVGNALHPVEHSEAAHSAATWTAAHLIFAVGAVLIAVGLPALLPLGTSRWAGAVRALLFVGFAVTVPISSYHEAFVVTHVDADAGTAVEGAASWLTTPLGTLFLLGQLLLGIHALRRPSPALGRMSGALVVLATLVMAVGGSGAPGPEGIYIIPATVLMGAIFAVAGVKITRASAPADSLGQSNPRS
ncbi:hypothetical protein [Williamsia sterculiae]|uniref:DUF998 domain-containing protein n=1 Tax=Williamsia sterculiae TaxID=1344003 RepID=A0A1N7GXX0_9NOCA|nr:hypothetical protein [Williamsia sterculiae]SIS17402.1 hypothetical protein SAMN05445060_3255 [Williamsia sterculiae]